MWYYASAGDYEGPFQEDFIGRKLRAGVITKETLVWRDGMSDWLPLGQTELAQLLTAQAPWHASQPPSTPKQPPVASPAPESDSASLCNPTLDDYQQRGYEEPQLHRQPADAKTSKAPRTVGRWVDLSGLTLVTSVLLGLSAAVAFLQVFGSVGDSLDVDYGRLVNPSIVDEADRVAGVLHLTVSVLFLLWFYRAMRNAGSLGARSLDLNPGVVILSFFLPLINLIIPYVAMRKLWRASYAPRQWTTEPVSPVVTVMWLGWIFGEHAWSGYLLASCVPLVLTQVDYLPSVNPVGAAIGIAAQIAAIIFINSVWKAQEFSRNSSDAR